MARVDERTSLGPQLLSAIEQNDTEGALSLIKRGADVDFARSFTDEKITENVWPEFRIVPAAISKGNIPVLREVLQRGANISIEPSPPQKKDPPLLFKTLVIIGLVYAQFYGIPFLPTGIPFLSDSILLFTLLLPVEGYIWRTVRRKSMFPHSLYIGSDGFFIFSIFFGGIDISLKGFLWRRVVLYLYLGYGVIWNRMRMAHGVAPGIQAILGLCKFKGDAEEMALLLLTRMDLGSPTLPFDSCHALFDWAVRENYLYVTHLLIRRGLSPSLQIIKQQYPRRTPKTFLQYHFATLAGNTMLTAACDGIMQMSRQWGHIPELSIPLVVASSKGHSEMAQVLLVHGFSVFQEHHLNEALIHCIRGCEDTTQEREATDRKKIVRALLLHGANPLTATDNEGLSPLLLASQRKMGHVFLQPLLDHGAGTTISSINSSGRTTLHYAVCHWLNMESVKLLIDAGAPINAQDMSGSTPLHCAVDEGYRPERAAIVSLLLKAGASPIVPPPCPDFRQPLVTSIQTQGEWTSEILQAARRSGGVPTRLLDVARRAADKLPPGFNNHTLQALEAAKENWINKMLDGRDDEQDGYDG